MRGKLGIKGEKEGEKGGKGEEERVSKNRVGGIPKDQVAFEASWQFPHPEGPLGPYPQKRVQGRPGGPPVGGEKGAFGGVAVQLVQLPDLHDLSKL